MKMTDGGVRPGYNVQAATAGERSRTTCCQAQPPWYRRTAYHWVIRAKRAETRAARLATLIADSAAGRAIHALRRPTGKRS